MRTVASSDETQAVKDLADYVCDGVADEVQINAALADVSSNTLGYGTQGGKVVLIGRKFTVAGPILMRTQTELVGAYGKYATRVYGHSSYTAGAGHGLIELFADSTQYCTVRDIGLNGSTSNVSGIYYFINTIAEWDSSLVVKDLHIMKTGQHGVHFVNSSGGKLRGNLTDGLTIIDAGKSGVYADCPDSDWSNIQIGSSIEAGFVLNKPNNRLTQIKSWYSATGPGFLIQNGRGDNALSACEAQDNFGHGFQVTSSRNNISGCNADSNGYSRTVGTSTGSGFFCSANGNVFTGTANEKNEDSRQTSAGGQQRYILEVTGAPKIVAKLSGTGNVGNVLNGTAGTGSDITVVGF